MFRRALTVILTLAAAACYSAGTAGKAADSRSRSVLLAEEIQATSEVSTAYDAVRRLRPEFLQTRGARSVGSGEPDPILVYMNGVFAGGVDVLTRIPASDIKAIRHLNGRDATTRYGTGHGGGVLEIQTGN